MSSLVSHEETMGIAEEVRQMMVYARIEARKEYDALKRAERAKVNAERLRVYEAMFRRGYFHKA